MDRDQPLFTSLSYRRRNKRIGDTNARRLSKLDHLRGERTGWEEGKGKKKGGKNNGIKTVDGEERQAKHEKRGMQAITSLPPVIGLEDRTIN